MVRTALARRLAEIRTSNYCIAYLDVLGAEEFMKNEQNDKFLNDLNSIYTDAVHDVKFTNLVTKKDVHVKIFSDNILLAIKVDKKDNLRQNKIETIINLTGNIYNNALYHGYLMRGAITEGPFYKDDDSIFVYGKALIDAVKMEEKFAIYPRIIVQESIQKTLPQYFLKCNDGCVALLNFIFTGLISQYAYKNNLLEMYKKYYKDDKIRQKIIWVMSHFNSYYANSATKIQITEKELNNVCKTSQ